MKIGNFNISPVDFGLFRLDGGSMFGSVPKNIWSKQIKADPENCIELSTRSLFIQDATNGNKILIDVGMGEKWDERSKLIYGIRNTSVGELPFKENEITHIILTHLHFDHAGGISRYTGARDTLELVYPHAQVFVQKANFENARAPNRKEKASYLKENVEVLNQAKMTLVEGEQEVYPGIIVHRVDGHTRGQQWIEISSGDAKIFYPTDLVPTSHHLPVPFHMGYDICAETVLREKEQFLTRAEQENAIVVFEHDSAVVAARIGINPKGHFSVREVVSM